ncbi:MAG: WD40 repeat domain-containing serine/threonine protein kinase [Phycisphaerales bacterium JB039]
MGSSPSSDRVKEAFAEALAAPAQDRALALARACGGDVELRARVEALLAAHDEAGVFMAEPTAHPDTPSGEAGAEVGQSLGAFTLEKVIGEGGFGTVFLGRQEAPIRRLAAIKVLKPGMDSRQVIARFEAERQTLAMMEHEGIAKVIDAGTTASGRPFVAMEYVPGEYVTEYCDRMRLTIEQRLALFDRICQAVQHAHQKGVIHRDLKPSNILVTEVDGQPVPKIIDFGIAKALADGRMGAASRITHGHQLLGTPEYMSPEQATGEELDTRSDVYSLGVLLYELLCGASPFDRQLLRRAGPAQLERILREDQPARPSGRLGPGRPDAAHAAAMRRTEPQRLARELRGDLDWIVIRAMEKDPERRYPTANALRADIRRRLEDQPVEAGPPSLLYIGRKFMRRHRGAAIGIGMAGLAILAALVFASIGFYRARIAGFRAEEALAEVERQLGVALLAQARAMRRTDSPGRKFESLRAIASAAARAPSVELRSEAIAAMALSDVRMAKERERSLPAYGLGLDRIDRLAEVEGPGRVRVVSIGEGEERMIAQLEGPAAPAQSLLFSPDGRFLSARFAVDGAEQVRVWDVETSRTVLAMEEGFQPIAIAFGRDGGAGPVVAIGTTDGAVTTYDLPQGQMRARAQLEPGWKLIAVSTGGAQIAMSRYVDPEVVIYDMASGTELMRLEAPAPVLSLEWSADDRFLAGGAQDFSVCVWEPRAGPTPRLLRGHQGQPVTLEFAASGPLLASAAWDNTVRLWDAEAGFGLVGAIEHHALAGFGQRLLTLRDARLMEWEYDPGLEFRTVVLPRRLGVRASLALEPTSGLAATGGAHGATIWDLAGGQAIAEVTDEEALNVRFVDAGRRLLTLHMDGLRSWPIRREGDRVVAGPGEVIWSGAGDMRMWSGRDETELLIAGPQGAALVDHRDGSVRAELAAYDGIATNPSIAGDLVFTGNWKGRSGRVRSLATGQTLLELKAEHVVGAFSPDGSLLVLGTGREFICYQTEQLTEQWRAQRDNTDSLAGMIAFAGDGSLLALGRSRFSLDLVTPEDGRELAHIESPDRQALGAVAIDERGEQLVVATTGDRLQVIDLKGIRQRLAAMGLDWGAAQTVEVER